MFITKETKRTKQLELYKDGELVQKVCKRCQRVKLAEDFSRYAEGHTRPLCRDCYKIEQRKYIKSVKDKRTVYKQRNRARELGLPDQYTEEDFKALKEFAGGRCMISNKKVDDLQVDHFMALSKKGLGSTKGNTILVSEEVNQKKRTKSVFELLESEYSSLVDKEQLKKTMSYLAEANSMTLAQYIQFLKDMEELAHNAKNLWR